MNYVLLLALIEEQRTPALLGPIFSIALFQVDELLSPVTSSSYKGAVVKGCRMLEQFYIILLI